MTEMTEIFVIIRIGDKSSDYQYAVELDKGSIEQLAILNSMLDVAKGAVVGEINQKTKG